MDGTEHSYMYNVTYTVGQPASMKARRDVCIHVRVYRTHSGSGRLQTSTCRRRQTSPFLLLFYLGFRLHVRKIYIKAVSFSDAETTNANKDPNYQYNNIKKMAAWSTPLL